MGIILYDQRARNTSDHFIRYNTIGGELAIAVVGFRTSPEAAKVRTRSRVSLIAQVYSAAWA
jgi:hypothetical protein